MPRYVIVYLGGNQPSSPEEGQQHFAKYMEWITSLGDSAVSPANPLKDTSTVNPDGSVTTGGTCSARDDQGHDADDGGEGGHQDRAQTYRGCLDHGLYGWQPFFYLIFIGELDD